MGSNDFNAAKPVHLVTISRSFAIGKTEITQGQWKAMMGSPPAELEFKNCGDDCPVERVSWNDIQEFIRKLNAESGNSYRLPSEAEWEYACRAGGSHDYCGGNNPGAIAWNKDNSAYFGERDRSFRLIVTVAQRDMLRGQILLRSVTMGRYFSPLGCFFASVLTGAENRQSG